jgi:hypothetical protein
MARKYVTVMLTARVLGDSFVLLDVHGKRIAVVPAIDAVECSKHTINSIEMRTKWREAFSGMLGSLGSKRHRMQKSPWEIKIQTWMASLRHRRNRKVVRYGKNFRYSDEKRKMWSDAVTCLLSQYNQKLCEYRLRSKNPWRLWAQTVSGNHRKKGCVYADSSVPQEKERSKSNGETVGANVDQQGIQMQLHWNRDDACSVVA